jgi:hypothetical protein
MTSISTTALLVIVGIGAGPYGLNLLSSPVLLLLDPAIAMALAMLGVFVGLSVDARRPRLTTPVALALISGLAVVAFRDSPPSAMLLAVLGIVAVAASVAIAGWLLVGQADSDREQQVFVIGSLLLLGGSAAYSSLSAVFAGVLAGVVWNAAGDLAKARIVQHLEYFQHPLFVVLLLAAGASITLSFDALAAIVIVAAFHFAGRPITAPFPVPAGVAALAVALDVFRAVIT